MVHEDRQPKVDALVRNCWLVALALLAVAGAPSSAAQEGGAGGAPVLVPPGWTHAPPPRPPARLAASSPAATPAGWPRLHITDPVGRHAARKALNLAWEWLAHADCAGVLSTFADRAGHRLDLRLRGLDVDLQAYLTMVVFIDGSRETPCRTGVLAFTAPGSRVVRVCVHQLKRAWQENPEHTAAIFIHEMLHTLGLDENPPTTGEITRRVLSGCRRGR